MLTNAASAALLSGFGLGLSLILSIGPQNLHLIRVGASQAHGWVTATAGYCSEILIFLATVSWMATLRHGVPGLSWVLYVLGIGFLVFCGIVTIVGRNRQPDGLGAGGRMTSLRMAVLGMLSVTWFNPLVYLEVGLVAGSVSLNFRADAKAAFVVGFLTASAIKFYGWSSVGQSLGPWLRRGTRMTWFKTASGSGLLAVAMLMAWHGFLSSNALGR